MGVTRRLFSEGWLDGADTKLLSLVFKSKAKCASLSSNSRVARRVEKLVFFQEANS